MSSDKDNLSEEVALQGIVLDRRVSLAKSRTAESSAGDTATEKTLRWDRGHSVGGKWQRWRLQVWSPSQLSQLGLLEEYEKPPSQGRETQALVCVCTSSCSCHGALVSFLLL